MQFGAWLLDRLKEFSFENSLWGSSVLQWLTALLVFVGVCIVLRLGKEFVRRRAIALAKDRSRDWVTAVTLLSEATHAWFLNILACYAASLWLTLPNHVLRVVESIAAIAVLLQAGIWGTVALSFGMETNARRRLAQDAASVTMLSALAFLGRWVLWAIVLLLVLDNLGINVTTLIASLGVGGVAVALAAQSILRDLLASFSIVLDRPFLLGDFIAVGDLQGTVENIGLRTTHLRSLSGEQIIIPNSDLTQSRVRNYKRQSERRAVFTFGIAYNTPPEKLAAIPRFVREIVEAQQATRFDRSHFKEFNPAALVFETVYTVTQADYNLYMDIQQQINLAICARFRQEEIAFAPPPR